jgi:parvulin-like peptidyl-prolyl isomerase
MKPEISAAVFAAKAPQILKPIVGAKGVYLIRVEEVIQPQLDEKLRYQILSDLFGVWVRNKLEEVEIVANLNSDSQID